MQEEGPKDSQQEPQEDSALQTPQPDQPHPPVSDRRMTRPRTPRRVRMAIVETIGRRFSAGREQAATPRRTVNADVRPTASSRGPRRRGRLRGILALADVI